jgi:putative nucleotidyltransferase with HDIG domain
MGVNYSRRPPSAVVSRPAASGPIATTASPSPKVRLLELIGQLEPVLRDVVRRALFDEPGRFDKFASAPASLNGHHRVRGGNLLHTIEVAECALLMASRFAAMVDRQIVLASALLHDLGKCEEYEQTSRGMFMSEAGKMLGHKAIGCAMVWDALEPLRKRSSRRALAVMNAVASASGRSYDLRGHSTLEAVIVSKADQLSAAADLYRESLANCGNSYFGVKHLHMAEQPRHPVALIRPPVQARQVVELPRMTRAQRFGGS